MNKFIYPQSKPTAYFISATTFAVYAVVFATYHQYAGAGLGSLAILPVICGGWYFGIRGGFLAAALSILLNIALVETTGQPFNVLALSLDNSLRISSLFIIAVVIGKLGTTVRERSEAFRKLKMLEEERHDHIELLETLQQITSIVLETDDLNSALTVLVESIGKLFKADDCFFAFWDQENQVTTPIIAYGSMKESYPKLIFEPGERTLTAVVIEAGYPLIIEDLKISPLVNLRIASLFPNHSMLGIPLIVQGNRIAAFTLGYNKKRQFESQEINLAEIAAKQIALVVTKLRLLENTQLQVKQLTVLHEVAMITTEAETIDQLIERTTEVIGKNLFSDNFGILLIDDKKDILYPHPSYRFVSSNQSIPSEVPLGKGISGQVAQSGIPILLKNIKEQDNYLNVDSRTVSELCVPIKIKDHTLGVINTESANISAYTKDDEFLLVTLAGQLATAIEQLRSEEAERKWLEQLAHSNELTYALAHITTHIEKKYHIDDVVQTLGDELNKINITSMITIKDQEKEVFRVNYTSISTKTLKSLGEAINFPLEDYTFSMDDLYSRIRAENLTQPMSVSDPDNEFRILIPHRFNKQMSISLQETDVTLPLEIFRLPLLFEEKLLGILWLWGETIAKSDLPIMSIFANQIGINIQNAYLFQEIQSLALTDPLTNLHNRRSLFELGRIEFSRAHRMNRPFCCMMLDLDHFKKVNDTYGHPVGDQVLQKFADHCKKSVRDIDLVGRYGGEELIIFLPETDLGTAKMVAERLLKSLADKPMEFPNHEALSITASIGLSGKDQNTLQLETLISRADQAMYIAKHKGRNRVAVSI